MLPAFNKLSTAEVENLKSEGTKIALDKFLDRVIEQSFTTTMRKESNVASNVAVEIQNIDNVTVETLNGAFSTIFDVIASNIADEIQNADNEVVDVFESVDDTLVSNIADAIVDIITGKDLILLKTAKQPINREMLFSSLSLKNQRKSYNEYVKPLLEFNWLSMTLPDKPTSPKQQYITTLKGRLILKFLNIE